MLTETEAKERLIQILRDGHTLAVSMANDWLDQVERLPRTIPARTEAVVRERDAKGRIVSTETITHAARKRNYTAAVHQFIAAAKATVSEHRPLDAIYLDLISPYLITYARVKRLAASTDAVAFIEHAFGIMGYEEADATAAFERHMSKCNRQLKRIGARHAMSIRDAQAGASA